MSVLAAHTQSLPLTEQFRGLKVDDIRDWSMQQKGDGVSVYVGERMSKISQDVVGDYWDNYQIGHSNLGSWVILRGFTPSHLTMKGMSKMWERLSLGIHEPLTEYHRGMYKSELDDVIKFVQQDSRQAGWLDLDTYARFFEENPGMIGESGPYKELRKLMHHKDGNLLRRTFGWAGAFVFDNKDAILTMNSAFSKAFPSGAMENNGFLLDRSPVPVSTTEMAEIDEGFDEFTSRLQKKQRQRQQHTFHTQLYAA